MNVSCCHICTVNLHHCDQLASMCEVTQGVWENCVEVDCRKDGVIGRHMIIYNYQD